MTGPEPLTLAWYRSLRSAELRELADDNYRNNMIYPRARAELDRRASLRKVLVSIAIVALAALAAVLLI